MGSCRPCTQANVVYISINIRKIELIAYIYVIFDSKVDEKSGIRAKIEAGKHLHAGLYFIYGPLRSANIF